MASYPTSVKSFTTKIDGAGNKIFAAHVNDVQAEISAIEDGILNGTAPFNSSNSTVANFSVSGKSTMVGNVQMNGNCTVTGTLTVGAFSFSSIVQADAQPRCKVVKASTQSVANTTWTALTFDAEDFDVGSLHSTASNPSRITIQSTGIWMFGATVASTLNSQSGFVSLRKNGTTFVSARVKFLGNSSLTESGYVATIEQMTSTGDYMECVVFQNTGGALEFGTISSSRVDQPDFWAVKLF